MPTILNLLNVNKRGRTLHDMRHDSKDKQTFRMKHLRYLLLAGLLALQIPGMAATHPIDVQPAFWWSGMHNTSLQIMLHAKDIGKCNVSVEATDIKVDSIYRPANANYLFVYLDTHKAQPQRFHLSLQQGRKKQRIAYELKARDNQPKAQGFDAADVLYLLMPDRFANADATNDVVKGLKENLSNQAPDNRHGGDLAGMTRHLNYLDSLGVTTIWPTPLLCSDMPAGSYHGYAITNYYEIDPRYGSNKDYKLFVDAAHKRGMKVVQDMVFNHCGSENFLFTDLPDSTWFNNNSCYTQTGYKITAATDAYASQVDKFNAQDGWFVSSMPDFNQRNTHVMRYLTQNAIWWIEFAGIDGIRQDTYPYADRYAMAQWCKELKTQYPHLNIVGETWLNSNVGVSAWQKDSKVAKGLCNSELPTVMDFPLMSLLNSALDEQTNEWDQGLARIYNYLSQDAVYADPTHLLTFLSNHDTNRFACVQAQADLKWRYKQAITLLLTLRGIPQLYYGDELAMAANKSKGDGALRQNFPGGFAHDSINAFTGEHLTPLMQHTHALTRKLLQWRKGCDAVKWGSFCHFAPKEGVYVYARQYKGHVVTVMINGTNTPACVDLAHYAEVLPKPYAHDVLSGRRVNLDKGSLQMGVREVLVLDFEK